MRDGFFYEAESKNAAQVKADKIISFREKDHKRDGISSHFDHFEGGGVSTTTTKYRCLLCFFLFHEIDDR